MFLDLIRDIGRVENDRRIKITEEDNQSDIHQVVQRHTVGKLGDDVIHNFAAGKIF